MASYILFLCLTAFIQYASEIHLSYFIVDGVFDYMKIACLFFPFGGYLDFASFFFIMNRAAMNFTLL